MILSCFYSIALAQGAKPEADSLPKVTRKVAEMGQALGFWNWERAAGAYDLAGNNSSYSSDMGGFIRGGKEIEVWKLQVEVYRDSVQRLRGGSLVFARYDANNEYLHSFSHHKLDWMSFKNSFPLKGSWLESNSVNFWVANSEFDSGQGEKLSFKCRLHTKATLICKVVHEWRWKDQKTKAGTFRRDWEEEYLIFARPAP